MNSKRQVKSQRKKSTDNEFVFTEPQLDSDGNFQFTEPTKKKSKLMIFLLAAGGVVLLLALSVLAKGLFSSHKDDVAEETQPEEIEIDAKLTSFEGFDISQITDPPLVASKHRPGEKRTLYCRGQEFVFRWCPPGRFMMGSPSSEYPRGTGNCYSGSNFSDSDLDAIGDAMGYSKQEKEEIIEQAHSRAFVESCIPDFNSHGRSEEEVLHPVTLTEGFWMLETEITYKQYGSIINGHSDTSDDKPNDFYSWDDSQNFCKKCSQLGMKVQLPTEAQWEYACRAGTQTAFCFGDSYDDLCKYGNYCDKSFNSDIDIVKRSYQDNEHYDGFQFIAPVKSFRPNAWGLYDMHGNVAEWCSDPYGGYIIEHQVNPTGDEEYTVIIVDIATPKTLYDKIKKRDNSKHVVRGGAYLNHFVYCRSASREGSDSRAGFRVMMTDKSMNDALANNMDKPPHEETVKEPVDDNKKEKLVDDSSKIPSGNSNNNNAADNGDFDDLIPVLSSDSKTSEPESSEPKPSDSETLDLESKPKKAPKAGDILVKEIDREKFVFRWIPPGIFTMGSPEDEEGRNPNERQYKVKISKGFWMMETEVTQEQWMVVTGEIRGSSRPSPKKPIENVSWYECNNFCKKAAAAGLPLELPTEAQWEYACRAGSRGAFAGSFEDLTWHHGNSDGHAQLIRTREPNKWGLYDMHGNVAEWVADWCGVYPSKPTKDPKGPADGAKKMTRGGSWGSPKHFCRSALRGGLDPNQRTVGLGFRCVLNIGHDTVGDLSDDSVKRPTHTSSVTTRNREVPDIASNTNTGDIFFNRGSGKARAVALGGGTTESERAVALGLKWIAEHQLPNGSWSFNHQLASSCRGECNNPGKLDKAFNGATGLALLPFLGAGVTHVNEGKYKTNVYNGINYLCRNGKATKDGCVSYLENGGTIYSHGIVALCLTEAYGMTKDKRILPAAQGSLKYICFHQDPNGGGWRYQPHQQGDTSASGWQISALKTGYWSGLDVPKDVVRKASLFLDSVQTDSGAKYGYTDPGAGPTTTAIGLLDRMYLGWKPGNPNLQRGVEWLFKIGPSKVDSYYNYYATMTMYNYNYNGPLWKKWNAVMREQMVNSQSQDGHEKGSWYNNTPWTERGGRLYDTALSTMVLETYYRYAPLYIPKTED